MYARTHAHARSRGVHPLASVRATLPGYRLAFNLDPGMLVEPRFANLEEHGEGGEGGASNGHCAPALHGLFPVQGVLHMLTEEQVALLEKAEASYSFDKVCDGVVVLSACVELLYIYIFTCIFGDTRAPARALIRTIALNCAYVYAREHTLPRATTRRWECASTAMIAACGPATVGIARWGVTVSMVVWRRLGGEVMVVVESLSLSLHTRTNTHSFFHTLTHSLTFLFASTWNKQMALWRLWRALHGMPPTNCRTTIPREKGSPPGGTGVP